MAKYRVIFFIQYGISIFFSKDMIHSIQIYSGRQSYVTLTYTDQQPKTLELDVFKSSVLDRSKFLKTSSKCYF
jgi:hypothetical protein